MKHRVCLTGMLAGLLLTLTACGGQDQINLTKEQEDLVGEYAAVTLLKYDAKAGSRLVDLSRVQDMDQEPAKEVPEPEITETKEPETLEEKEQDMPAADSPKEEQAFGSLAEYLELPEGLQLTCEGYEVAQSYEDRNRASFSMTADAGKALLLVYFELSNESGTQQQIDLLSRKDIYRITLNEKYTEGALTTLLMNDLSTYHKTLENAATDRLVLVFETDAEKLEDVTSLVLRVKNASESYTIQII